MNKFKIGSDICSIERVNSVWTKYGERFLDKVLTAGEKKYVLSVKPEDAASKIAARFAAKEATVKALGTGFRGVSFQEIEVVRRPSGEPSLKLSGRAAELQRQLNLQALELTISHEREYAIAFVLGYGMTESIVKQTHDTDS
jgi:holo-[acyl-carrier protein] synthase